MLVDQLRMFGYFVFMLKLLVDSMKDMAPFAIILFIINQGFMLGFLRSVNYCFDWMGECLNDEPDYQLIDQAQRNSFLMLFADFGEFKLDTRMQMTLFILWCVAIPILSMNLLIVSFLSINFNLFRHF